VRGGVSVADNMVDEMAEFDLPQALYGVIRTWALQKFSS
jgi:hypothetical protein